MNLYDKRGDFNFPIVDFYLYGVYVSQLIRFSRACRSYDSFDWRLLLTRKLLNQGFLVVKLKSLLRKSYGRHNDLVSRYRVSVSQMTTEIEDGQTIQ